MSLVALLSLALFVGKVFAETPNYYEIELYNGKQETGIATVSMNRYLSFDYWYSGNKMPRNLSLSIIDLNGYDDTNTRVVTDPIAIVPITGHEANKWNPLTVTVPSYMYLDPSGKPRTDVSNEKVEFALSYFTEDPFYINNVHTYASINNGGSSSDQPVPEPGTWAMMAMGALSLLGFEIRRRRAQQ
jgi:hypothetical protein